MTLIDAGDCMILAGGWTFGTFHFSKQPTHFHSVNYYSSFCANADRRRNETRENTV